jgi:dynein heavy chain
MDIGLAKLEEASCSVEILKKDLAIMEQELAQASEKAENVCFIEPWLHYMCF